MKANRPSGRRAAFTLIELAVVMAIIAILVAMLLPAVVKMRRSAARTQSLNNLKQIGTAITMYGDSVGYLPCNGTYTWGQPGVQDTGSWCYQIFPYLDRHGLYNINWQTAPVAARLRKLDVFTCPGRGRPGFTATSNHGMAGAQSDYAINIRLNTTNPSATNAPNAHVQLHMIPDGTATTILAGINSIPTTSYTTPNANLNSWDETLFSGGWGGTGRGGTSVQLDSPTGAFANNWGGAFQDGSLFLFCDGSVHLIRYGTDLTALLTPAGGEAVKAP
jgi:prepilin-type N-terminal cleavage/methylation domain-containing protein